MNKYYIYVWQTQYPDYPLHTGYDIEARDRYEAERIAREKFSTAYGFESKYICARVGWNTTIQKENLQYYREHGLPDEIPS